MTKFIDGELELKCRVRKLEKLIAWYDAALKRTLEAVDGKEGKRIFAEIKKEYEKVQSDRICIS